MFERYNDMSLEELSRHQDAIENLLKQNNRELKRLEKIKRKNIVWVFIIPLIGIFIYFMLLTRRNNMPEFQSPINNLKEQIISQELELKIIVAKIAEIQ